MTDELPDDAPLAPITDALAPIRAAAQIGLDFHGDAPAAESDWPQLPDDNYTPDELAAAYGDASADDDSSADETFVDDAPDAPESDAPRSGDELDAFIEAMDAQSAELQRQARQLDALERKVDETPRECVLA
jgi:hypothetical protein